MSTETPNWKLEADPKRQATDALRGYVYQAWQALHAWLELRNDQVIYLEGAEDFDKIDDEKGTAVQVKDTFRPITLRSECVTDAICHFWRLRNIHKGKEIEFHFLTHSRIGVEQGEPFGSGVAGLTVWQNCRGDPKVAGAVAKFLREDPTVSPRLSEDLKDYLAKSPPADILVGLVAPLVWLTQAPPVEAVVEAVDRKLIAYGLKFDVTPSDSRRVRDRLLREVLTLATQKECESRRLDFVLFAVIFEEETSVRVSRSQVAGLQQTAQWLGSGILRGVAGDTPIVFEAAVHALGPSLPPPLPRDVAYREEVVGRCREVLGGGGVLFLTGSTGMGKSTLAKLTMLATGGNWVWFNLSPFHGDRYAWALAEVAHLVDQLPTDKCIVLDDLALDPGGVPEWEQILAGMLYTIRSRCILLIATSRREIPGRLRNVLGVSPVVELTIPDFDEGEIKDLCVGLGCQAGSSAENQARVVLLHTGGHPQLVHARVLTLARQGWPEPSAMDLLRQPDDVKQQLSQARQLIDALDPQEKELLYRASVALSPFRRHQIVALGEVANLAYPGDLFDHLVGPWIEKSSGECFELSPLLRNAATQVWSRRTVEKVHSELADVILASRQLSPVDGAHALYHAFLGKNKPALSGLGVSLVIDASEDVRKAVAETAFWFSCMALEERNGLLFEEDPSLSLLLRMLQFRLVVGTEPEKAVRILDAWEKEVNQLDSTPENLASRLLFLSSGLVYVRVPIGMSRVLKLCESLISVQQAMMTPAVQGVFEGLPVLQVDKKGRTVELVASLFGINAMRCKTKDDLDELLDGVARLDQSHRGKLLAAFAMPEEYAAVYVDAAYLRESKAEAPDWPKCLAILRKAMRLSTEWACAPLGAAAARAAALVLDEHFKCPQEALVVLDEASMRFPSELWLIEGQRVTVLMHQERYEQALQVFTSALSHRDVNNRVSLLAPMFSFRDAAIMAARLGRWDQSASYFGEAFHCAEAVEMEVYMAAFQTDAGFAFWNAGRTADALRSLMHATELIDAMDRSKTNLDAFWVFRCAAHILSWLQRVAERAPPLAQLVAPLPGMCSNPQRNEKIRTLPDVPFELMLLSLVRVEHQLGVGTIALARYGARLDAMTLPVVAMFISLLRIEEAFGSSSLGNLPLLIDKHVKAYLATRRLRASGREVWDGFDEAIPQEQVLGALLEEDFLEGPILAALLKTCRLESPNSYAELIGSWRRSAVGLFWYGELGVYLDRVEQLLHAPMPELRTILHSRTCSARERQLAVLFLSAGGSGVALRDLLQAHVYLLDKFCQNSVCGEFVAAKLSSLISSAWARQAKLRFQLSMPRITGPALEAACSTGEESFAKVAAVLLAASEATGVKMPQVVLDRYRRLALGTVAGK